MKLMFGTHLRSKLRNKVNIRIAKECLLAGGVGIGIDGIVGRGGVGVSVGVSACIGCIACIGCTGCDGCRGFAGTDGALATTLVTASFGDSGLCDSGSTTSNLSNPCPAIRSISFCAYLGSVA